MAKQMEKNNVGLFTRSFMRIHCIMIFFTKRYFERPPRQATEQTACYVFRMGREDKAAQRRLGRILKESVSSHEIEARAKEEIVNSRNKKVLSNTRWKMEGGDAKPPPYNYGAIPTDSGYSAPPPYPAGGSVLVDNSDNFTLKIVMKWQTVRARTQLN